LSATRISEVNRENPLFGDWEISEEIQNMSRRALGSKLYIS
jgi:hypothetical protein